MEMTKAQAIDAATRIAQKLKPYTLRFQDASQGTFFFQCVFLRMVQVSCWCDLRVCSPSSGLNQA